MTDIWASTQIAVLQRSLQLEIKKVRRFTFRHLAVTFIQSEVQMMQIKMNN